MEKLLNDTHWVDYGPAESDAPPSKRKRKEEPRAHATGCARSEGFYKLDSKEKAKHKSHFARCVTDDARTAAEASTVSKEFCFCPNHSHYFLLMHFITEYLTVGGSGGWAKCRWCGFQNAGVVTRSSFKSATTTHGLWPRKRFRFVEIQPAQGNLLLLGITCFSVVDSLDSLFSSEEPNSSLASHLFTTGACLHWSLSLRMKWSSSMSGR